MPKIHPTAIVSDKAELADDVEVGPYAIIESDVRIGRGCRIAAHAIIRQYTQMGSDNVVDSFTVLGSLPQDYKFSSQTVSYLKIGDGNVFQIGRAHV
jgi:UDP-N-acetylglucosamine acyltransferase